MLMVKQHTQEYYDHSGEYVNWTSQYLTQEKDKFSKQEQCFLTTGYKSLALYKGQTEPQVIFIQLNSGRRVAKQCKYMT